MNLVEDNNGLQFLVLALNPSVFVTHNRDNCESISDEIVELEKGKLKIII